MGASIDLTVAGDLDTVALVARAVRAVAEERLSADELDGLELAVVEAVTNVIQHGYGGRAGEHLKVGISVLADRVEVEISDTAKPMKADLWTETSASMPEVSADNLDALPEGGMGIALIRATMDEVHYRRVQGGNVLKMTKFATPSP